MSGKATKLTSASGKRVEGAARAANGGTASANGGKAPAKKKGRKGPVVFWTMLILAVLLYIGYRATIKPPKIGEDPQIDNTQQENNDTQNNDTEGDEPAVVVPEDPSLDRKDGFYTFLIVGTDKAGANTDVLMVASFDTVNKEANIVNIPRDTLVNVSRKVKKINAAYSVGGMDNLLEEVSTLIGFEPDCYLMVDLEGFVALVDFIDGVDFDVPVNMSYDDPTQDLHIHYEKGLQHLEGQEALEVVRFRHNNDGTGYLRQDLDRIQTTQHLLSTVAKKMLTPATLLKINSLVEIAEENVETDLQFGEMLWIAKEALGVNAEAGIQFHTLSEQSTMYQGLSYVYVEEESALELINSTINPYTADITDLDVIQP